MNFDQLDQKMRKFETISDVFIPNEVRMVARIDGRSFTRLTKEICNFETPFDVRFRDAMVSTTESLMRCGFNVEYAFIQSDEISLLFSQFESQFGRKLRKFNSVLAAQASAHFSMTIGELATFDCRVSQLPTTEIVIDYFRWRQQDAHRNALNAHCYWALRKAGHSGATSHRKLMALSVSAKKSFLNLEFNIGYETLPKWQTSGTALFWETFSKRSINPITNVVAETKRRRIKVENELMFGDNYSRFLQERFHKSRR